MIYKDTGFRAVYHNFCVVRKNVQIEGFLADLPGGDEADGVVTYGYYDREEGLTLEVLAAAKLGEGQFRHAEPNKDVSLKIRVASLGDTEFYIADDEDGALTAKYADVLAPLAAYEVSDEIELTRKLGFLDDSREEFFIDDVKVNMVKMGLNTEVCWVRITGVREDHTFVGTLLNEPIQNFGWHVGDEIDFFVHKTEDDKIVCISDMIPTIMLKREDFEDGIMLKDAIERFADDVNERNYLEVLQILRDSYVWVPCRSILSEKDEASIMQMLADCGDDPDAMVGKTFVNHDNIRLVPDILESDGEFFFPAFSSAEEMGEYGSGFSKIARHMLDVIKMARANEKRPKGIVINAFGTGFILRAELFEMIEKMESRVQE